MSDGCPRCGTLHLPGLPCLALNLPTTHTHDELAVGSVLAGRYRIIRTIHHGGMSVVYQAEDLQVTNRQVALKELRPPEGASAEDLQEAEAWFARESSLLSMLDHPLIPTFFSVFREQGRSYIAQEYVAGENLDEFVRREGAIDEDTAVRWTLSLCDLLGYLHALPEPVIFRDLKPANILLRSYSAYNFSDKRALVVVDFGIARSYQPGVINTMVGTPGYAPPEQYQGLATPQSDVYALGATLHRLLTGYDPEKGAPFTFPPIAEFNPQASPELAALVASAVQLDPARRLPTVEAFKDALLYACPHLDEPAPAHATMATVRRRRYLLGALAAVMVIPAMLAHGYTTSAPGGWSDGQGYSFVQSAPEIAPPGYVPLGGNGGGCFSDLVTSFAGGERAAWGGPSFSEPGTATPFMTGESTARDVTGNVWFIDQNQQALAHTTLGGDIVDCPLGSSSRLQAITTGIDGSLWFTDSAHDRIGQVSLDDGQPYMPSTLSFFTLASGSAPSGIVVAANGTVWFSEQGANRIGAIDGSTVTREISLPNAASGPAGITAAPDGSVWFTESTGNRIGHLLSNGTIAEYPLPHANSTPATITTTSTGDVWFAERDGNRIGQITPSGELREFTIPSPGSQPAGITAGPMGTIWVAEPGSDRIGRFDPTRNVLNEYMLAPGSVPTSISMDATDSVLEWFGNGAGSLDVAYVIGTGQ